MASDRAPGNSRPAVLGMKLDSRTRCAHYNGATDIIAIRMFCCGEYYACAECHTAMAGHPSAPWPRARFGERAVLCGACDTELTITEYLVAENRCPTCSAEFNPRCELHHHSYFEPA